MSESYEVCFKPFLNILFLIFLKFYMIYIEKEMFYMKTQPKKKMSHQNSMLHHWEYFKGSW